MKGLSEDELVAGYAAGTPIVDDGPPRRRYERDRHLPTRSGVAGMHSCLRCVLALIPDSSPRQLCYFCVRSRR